MYVALATDTGCFKFSNTTPPSHIKAARLLAYGAQTAQINYAMFDLKTPGRMRLEQEVLSKIRYYAGGHIAVISTSLALLNDICDIDSDDVGALAALPRQIHCVDIGISIKEKKEFRDYVLNYHKTRYVIDELKACKNEKARQKYRDEHDSDFIILNAAKRYFDSKGLKKLPSHKALQAEVEQLIKEKNELYNQYQTAKEEAQRLDTIRHNIEQTLGRKIEHKQEQER